MAQPRLAPDSGIFAVAMKVEGFTLKLELYMSQWGGWMDEVKESLNEK